MTEPPTPTGITYISYREASERLGVSGQTLRNYVNAGRLTGYRLGARLVRLDLAEVDALLRPRSE